MKQVFYFINRTGVFRPTGEEYMRWDVSLNEHSSKKELQTEKRQNGLGSVRIDEIYTPAELIEKFSKPQIKNILKEIAKFRPDLVNKALQHTRKSLEMST